MRTTQFWMLLLLVLLLSLGTMGCGGDSDDGIDGDTTDGDTETDADQTDGDTVDGDTVDGDTVDGDTVDGDTVDGDTTDGDTIDGDSVDGDKVDGDMPDGDMPDGDMPDGDMPDGDMPDGDMPDGDMPDGDMPDGDMPDGDMTDGDMPDGDMPDGDMPDGDMPDGDMPDGDMPDGDMPDGDMPDGDMIDGDDPCADCADFPGTYCIASETGPACDQLVAQYAVVEEDTDVECGFTITVVLEGQDDAEVHIEGCEIDEMPILEICTISTNEDGSVTATCPGYCTLVFSQEACNPDGDLIDGDYVDGDMIDGDMIDGDMIDGDVIDGDVVDGDVVDGDNADCYGYGDCNSGCINAGYDSGICNDTTESCVCSYDSCDSYVCGTYYDNCSCSAADPCSWQGDNYCDDFCALAYPDDYFDDSADCTTDGDVDGDVDGDNADCYGNGDCNALCTGAGYDSGMCVDAIEGCACNYDSCDSYVCGTYYDNCSCAAADPCAWQGDNYCDDFCAIVYPDDHFDDSADCATDGDIDGDIDGDEDVPPCENDAYESDNESTAATTPVNGVSEDHSICPATDVDWWTFTLTAETTVEMQTSGASGDTRMWLYDSSDNEIGYNDDDTGLFSRIRVGCLPAGTYYVKVDEYGNNNEINNYQFTYTESECTGGGGVQCETCDPENYQPCDTGYECIHYTDDDNWFCVLDCTGGETCGDGMDCTSVGDVSWCVPTLDSYSCTEEDVYSVDTCGISLLYADCDATNEECNDVDGVCDLIGGGEVGMCGDDLDNDEDGNTDCDDVDCQFDDNCGGSVQCDTCDPDVTDSCGDSGVCVAYTGSDYWFCTVDCSTSGVCPPDSTCIDIGYGTYICAPDAAPQVCQDNDLYNTDSCDIMRLAEECVDGNATCNAEAGSCDLIGGGEENCGDDIDNDEDGNTDCDDYDCRLNVDCCTTDFDATCDDSFTHNNQTNGSSNYDLYSCTTLTESAPEVLYNFVSDTDKLITVDLTGLSADLDLFLLSSCDPNTCITRSTGTSDEQIQFNADAGVSYFIVVDGYSGAVSDYTLTFTCAEANKPFGSLCETDLECDSEVCYEGKCNQDCTFGAPARGDSDSCPANYTCATLSNQGDINRCVDDGQFGTVPEDGACSENFECQSGLYCDTSMTDDTVDTKLELWASDGAEYIAYNDDGGEGLYSLISHTFDVDGTYYLKVYGYSSTSTGYYQLVSEETPVRNGYNAISETEPNNAMGEANAIVIPALATGYIGTDDADWFEMNVNAGDTLQMQTRSVQGGSCQAVPACPTADVDLGAFADLPYTGTHEVNEASFDFGEDCTGWVTTGEDLMFELDLTEGDTIRVRVDTTDDSLDLGAYIGENCMVCLAGVDQYYGTTFDAFEFTAPATGTYHLVVDGELPSSYTSKEFTLTVEGNPADECYGITEEEGCCVGDTGLRRCQAGLVHEFTCEGDYPLCGWSSTYSQYSCTTEATEGDTPRSCPE